MAWYLDRVTEHLRDSERLATTIQQRVAAAHVPKTLADLRRGKSIEFGAAQLTPQGLMHADRLLPWADLKSIDLSGFGLRVLRHESWFPWARIPACELVNKYLFRSAAVEMAADQQSLARRAD